LGESETAQVGRHLEADPVPVFEFLTVPAAALNRWAVGPKFFGYARFPKRLTGVGEMHQLAAAAPAEVRTGRRPPIRRWAEHVEQFGLGVRLVLGAHTNPDIFSGGAEWNEDRLAVGPPAQSQSSVYQFVDVDDLGHRLSNSVSSDKPNRSRMRRRVRLSRMRWYISGGRLAR